MKKPPDKRHLVYRAVGWQKRADPPTTYTSHEKNHPSLPACCTEQPCRLYAIHAGQNGQWSPGGRRRIRRPRLSGYSFCRATGRRAALAGAANPDEVVGPFAPPEQSTISRILAQYRIAGRKYARHAVLAGQKVIRNSSRKHKWRMAEISSKIEPPTQTLYRAERAKAALCSNAVNLVLTTTARRHTTIQAFRYVPSWLYLIWVVLVDSIPNACMAKHQFRLRRDPKLVFRCTPTRSVPVPLSRSSPLSAISSSAGRECR